MHRRRPSAHEFQLPLEQVPPSFSPSQHVPKRPRVDGAPHSITVDDEIYANVTTPSAYTPFVGRRARDPEPVSSEPVHGAQEVRPQRNGFRGSADTGGCSDELRDD